MFIIIGDRKRMPKKRHGPTKMGPGRAGLLKDLLVGGPLKTNISK